MESTCAQGVEEKEALLIRNFKGSSLKWRASDVSPVSACPQNAHQTCYSQHRVELCKRTTFPYVLCMRDVPTRNAICMIPAGTLAA